MALPKHTRQIVCALALFLALVAMATSPVAAQDAPAQDGLTCDGRIATIVGTTGDDVIIGTSGRDVIVALEGNDTIRAGAGADIICAGPGRDRVLGGKGADRIFGGDEGDKLFGDAGADQIFGGRGNDLLVGGFGDDDLDGGRGRRDRLRGRAGTATCTDAQDGTTMDAVCNAPPPDPALTITSCETEEDEDVLSRTLIHGTWENTTDSFVGAVLIKVVLIDNDGIRFQDVGDVIENIRPGETVRWQTRITDDHADRIGSCRASTETSAGFEEVDDGTLWDLHNLQCAVDGNRMIATGRATNTSTDEQDLLIMAYITGTDGIRHGNDLLDLIDDALAGETFEFEAETFDAPPIGGIASCHAFVHVSPFDF